jgi:hypothetical protein
VVNVTAMTCWFTECVATATPSRPTWPSCSPALSVTRFTAGRTGRSVKKFARTARRYRAGRHALTAEDPPPPGLRNALAHIEQQERGMH